MSSLSSSLKGECRSTRAANSTTVSQQGVCSWSTAPETRRQSCDMTPLITHRSRLEQYQEALLVMHSTARHRAIKAVSE
jgi:hypothetical protein